MAATHDGLSEEDFALLGYSDLRAEESQVPGPHEEQGDPVLAGFRERLLLGDLSW
jgi:hypothetical protein